jgi:hypothetical protein
VRKLLEESDKQTKDYADLAEDRSIEQETLMQWGICRSIVSGDWLVPGYGPSGAVMQAYRYARTMRGKRMLPTPTIGHALHGVYQYDPECKVVYICEGPWDGLAMWEALSKVKETEDGLSLTASREASLLSYCSVLAVPGASVFNEGWESLLSGKDVVVMFDNDHPRKSQNGQAIPPTGYQATQRLVRVLRGSMPSASIKYLSWGKEGYDETLSSGTDVRDIVSSMGHVEGLKFLLGRVKEAPKEWKGRPRRGGSDALLAPKKCGRYKDMENAWKKAMKWTKGLDHALAVMLASIASTKSLGDQLWIKVIGPAACGKSTLAEAVTVSRHVFAKSTLRGFFTGYRLGDGQEDCSLVKSLYDKTLVTKDGDTLLQAPNLPQILSEARDLYDGTGRSHYRNAMGKNYEGVRFTWILCGTSSLRSIDQSELGERFLDVVIMEGIDDDLEDQVLWRVVHRAVRNLAVQPKSQYEPALADAMALTGGYVDWLRNNAAEGLSKIENPTESLSCITRIGKFVAHMRARPSEHQEETAEREFASRLVSQLTRLANCLAMVLNYDSIEPVMGRVRQVALDTSRGQTLAIASHLYMANEEGSAVEGLATGLAIPTTKVRGLLRFLQAIRVAKPHKSQKTNRVRWKLTPRMRALYTEVFDLE